MSGKLGRPPEDRLLRQCEIYRAVPPLLLSAGARGLTMRDAARAACMSLGGLNHYFPIKQQLVLFGVEPAAGARLCVAFHAQNGWRKPAEPSRVLAAWVDVAIDGRRRVTAVFAGRLPGSHREACAHVERTAVSRVPGRFDVVVIPAAVAEVVIPVVPVPVTIPGLTIGAAGGVVVKSTAGMSSR